MLMAWGFRQRRANQYAEVNAYTLAGVRWMEEVLPTVKRLRDTAPTDLADSQLYITELARRFGIAMHEHGKASRSVFIMRVASSRANVLARWRLRCARTGEVINIWHPTLS